VVNCTSIAASAPSSFRSASARGRRSPSTPFREVEANRACPYAGTGDASSTRALRVNIGSHVDITSWGAGHQARTEAGGYCC
jgi:hypothetical protein